MEIITAENLGLKFKLHYEKGKTFKETIARSISKQKKGSQEFWALRRVNFGLEQGEILGVIGRNGSGKSTLLRVIGSIYSPDEGQIKVTGTVSTLLSITAGFKSDLSGIENIYLNGALMGFNEKQISAVLRDIVEFSDLNHFIHAPVKTYSSGMYARLGFSIAAHLKRDIMLIDEILGVGDARFRQKSDERIRRLMEEGRTIVLVSHNLESIKKFATRVIWLEKGSVVREGKPKEVIEQYMQASLAAQSPQKTTVEN